VKKVKKIKKKITQ